MAAYEKTVWKCCARFILGGWVLVANFVSNSTSPSNLDRWVIIPWNQKLYQQQNGSHSSFTQIRFHFSKKQGRTFHVTTVSNSTGEAVVQYFSGQTDAPSDSCGSFQITEGENSKSVMDCKRWSYVGKWGYAAHVKGRLYKYAAYVPFKYHWHLLEGYWYCDAWYHDFVSRGDFWKIYVR